MMRPASILIALVTLLPGAAVPARAQAPREEMDRKVRSAIAALKGSVCLYARNLDTGASYGLRENEKVRTASTIKLPVMATVFAAVAAGRAKWTGEIVLRDADKVSGSGVLTEFSDGVRLPLSDVLHLMIVVSDNTATNLILERFSTDAVNGYMDKLGLHETRVLRKVLSGGRSPDGISKAGRVKENKRFGLGVSTSKEMVGMIEML